MTQTTDAVEDTFYNGENDHVLPSGLRRLLDTVPEQTADEIRKEISGVSIIEIHQRYAADYPMPDTTSVEDARAHVQVIEKADIQHFAELFQILSAAGVPAEAAIGIVRERVTTGSLSAGNTEDPYVPVMPFPFTGSHTQPSTVQIPTAGVQVQSWPANLAGRFGHTIVGNGGI